ncbi:hypothetical protein IFM89_022727 [Coptis chinensis]|uniref:Scarecrow-like protein 8 n=1 Tax=Coptis chinensis TaxID=261450 RepID=A0A835M975_9MAGN|nr:hypothetical protein IFM89_022727 [Coptis chinensis]
MSSSGFSSSGGNGGGGVNNNGFFLNNTAGFNTGSPMINNVQLQYRQQLQDQMSSVPLPRRPTPTTSFAAKRPFSEQQQGVLFRSVKQRNQYNQTSPISPLTPFDFSSSLTGQTSISNNSNHPHLQNFRSLSTNNNFYTSNNGYNNHHHPSYLNSSLSQVYSSNRTMGLENSSKEIETEKKMRNKLQELEKQLLDDDEEDDDVVVTGDFNSSSSIVTTSEWSETMQSLITPTPAPTPKPFSPTPSCCSSSSSSSPPPLISSSSKQSFIDIANAISEGNTDVAVLKLETLKQVCNLRGDSEQRFIPYMVSALRSKINPTENPPPIQQLFSNDHVIATQMLFEASPCFKYGFMASNLAIVEATTTSNVIHVLDFDIGQGSQYITLIHAIAEKHQSRGIPIFIKITSVVLNQDYSVKQEDQRMVGDRLKKLADRVGLGFRFNIVEKPIFKLSQETLGIESDEALVVNFAFRLFKLSDESVSTENQRDELLRLVKSFSPRVVTLLEQEMSSNTASFVARVGEVSSYYLALFNSLDSTINRDGPERVKIEECLGRKAANSVACEGKERVERCEVFGKWRARMKMAGFVTRPLGQHVAESMKSRLNTKYKNNSGFTVKEESDGICFGWLDRVLTVASAWC